MAPWFAAMAVAVAWLTLTVMTLRDNRHMTDNTSPHTVQALVVSPDGSDYQTIRLEVVGDDWGVTAPEAGRAADAWAAANMPGWTVRSVTFPEFGGDGTMGPRFAAPHGTPVRLQA